MRVELIAYTRPTNALNPCATVERAACKCYDSRPTQGYAIAKKCAETGHMSVWEHINFVFDVDGVSRSLLAQLTRHRHLSFTVRSQRYCTEKDREVVTPAGLLPKDRYAVFDAATNEAFDRYEELLEIGAKPEDARAVLPNACCTSLVVSGNARAIIEASHERLCYKAQEEIRRLFKMMEAQISLVCPEVARMMVPKCLARSVRYCDEHNGCGMCKPASEVRWK